MMLFLTEPTIQQNIKTQMARSESSMRTPQLLRNSREASTHFHRIWNPLQSLCLSMEIKEKQMAQKQGQAVCIDRNSFPQNLSDAAKTDLICHGCKLYL